MDFEILPQTVIILSATSILFILGKNFSKMKAASEEEALFIDNTIQEEIAKEKFLYLYKRALRRINKENYQKKIAEFWVWFEKFLRKLRIRFLKLDGKMVAMLENIRKKNSENQLNLRQRMELSVRMNMEKENLSKFWKAKRADFHRKERRKSALPVEVAIAEPVNAPEAMPAPEIVQDLPQAEPIAEIEELEIISVAGSGEEEAVQAPTAAETPGAAEMATEAAGIEDAPAEEEDAEKEEIRTKKEEEYIETLMKNPADTKAYWKLGNIYSKRRNYEDALACFHQIVKIDPGYTKAKQKILELMEKMKRQSK